MVVYQLRVANCFLGLTAMLLVVTGCIHDPSQYESPVSVEDDAGADEADATSEPDGAVESDASFADTCASPTEEEARSSDGLIALYTFIEGDGGVVQDRSGHSDRLDLAFSGDVNWSDDCDCVEFDGGKLSHDNPQRLYDAISGGSQTFTMEAWVKSADLSQSGPARIVSLSDGTSDRNFTLGQREGQIEIRFRHAESDDSGYPYLRADDAISEELDHYVVTFSDGELRLYRNGALLANEERSEDLRNWDDGYPLLVGNESSDNRPWRGHVYLVSIYERALSVDEITDHFEVGP